MKKITKDMTFGEILMSDPGAGEMLANEGLFCGGCPMAQFETLEQGAIGHGMDPNDLVKKLNKAGEPGRLK